jgi:hypothetical protein
VGDFEFKPVFLAGLADDVEDRSLARSVQHVRVKFPNYVLGSLFQLLF